MAGVPSSREEVAGSGAVVAIAVVGEAVNSSELVEVPVEDKDMVAAMIGVVAEVLVTVVAALAGRTTTSQPETGMLVSTSRLTGSFWRRLTTIDF